MPGLLAELKKLFGSEDLYKVLDVESSATKAEVKKAYYKLSLTVHPDRVEKGKALATQKFQLLGKVYSILSDDEKRAAYDEIGLVDEDVIDKDRNWTDYWRLLFPKVDLDDINKFEENYKGSEEELEDIKSAYLKYEGDMGKILDSIMCSTIEDEPRFRSTIKDLIEQNELPQFDAFVNEPETKRESRKRKAEKEEKAAKKALKKLKTDKGSDNLQALILQNQKSRQEAADDFFKQMEKKYSDSKPTSSGKKSKKKSQ